MEVLSSAQQPATNVLDHALNPSVDTASAAALVSPTTLPPQTQSTASKIRSGHLNLDTFSPVNQNGSFEFDKVLKSGFIQKRTRKTKQWRTFYLVLRPNLLSMYKSSSEEKLHKQILLSDLTAVAPVKDPKGKRQHLFGLYSPSRNFHLQARSEEDAQAWIRLIKQEARIDEEHNEALHFPPTGNALDHKNILFPPPIGGDNSNAVLESERYASSSPEPLDPLFPPPSNISTIPKSGIKIPNRGSTGPPHPLHTSDLESYSSTNEIGSYSEDPSSGGETTTPGNSYKPTTSFGSFLEKTSPKIPQHGDVDPLVSLKIHPPPAATPATDPSATISNPAMTTQPPAADLLPPNSVDRVIHASYLHLLKRRPSIPIPSSASTISKPHLAFKPSWKRLWVVLRLKSLTFYKSEDEYAALKIIPISSIVDAVEIDPIGKNSHDDDRRKKQRKDGAKERHKVGESKKEPYCYMQIIGEEKSWRFCCKGGEEELERWLGSLKSRVVATRRRRKEVVAEREKDADADGRGDEGLG